jgi:hypothetical protein
MARREKILVMTPTADDYAWFADDGYGLTVESCITLVKGLTSEEVVRRVGGAEVARMTGLDDLLQHRFGVEVRPDRVAADGSYNADAVTDNTLVAVTDLPGGALMLEQHGELGIWHSVNGPLSRGTTVVSVCITEVNEPRFVWVQDGDVQLNFDMFFAAWREGSNPNSLVDVMKSIGFNFNPVDDPDDPGWVFDPQAPVRAFALAEHVTGVGFTRETLDTSTYRCASVPRPT